MFSMNPNTVVKGHQSIMLISETYKYFTVILHVKAQFVDVNKSYLSKQENFLSFWKLCSSSTYIEVWLYCQEQFDEKEAINGHSGYLLIEQWEVEIKSKRYFIG